MRQTRRGVGGVTDRRVRDRVGEEIIRGQGRVQLRGQEMYHKTRQRRRQRQNEKQGQRQGRDG